MGKKKMIAHQKIQTVQLCISKTHPATDDPGQISSPFRMARTKAFADIMQQAGQEKNMF